MILVCGNPDDERIAQVCVRLLERGADYCLLDLSRYPLGYQISWRWQGGKAEGYIAADGWRVEIAEISSVFVRYPELSERIASVEIEPTTQAAIYAESSYGLGAMLEQLPALVVNRQRGAMSNQSKPYQALIIRECGMFTPTTLITSDANEARLFYARHGGEVIYKSLSGVRSRVERMDGMMLARLKWLRDAPAQLQAYVPGDNVRVHIVGEELFATRVASAAVDYRFAEVTMTATTLPTEVSAACRELARRFDLPLAGIDLKRTAEGKYYCFEANPAPDFLYYERHSGQPISAALADLLMKPMAQSVL